MMGLMVACPKSKALDDCPFKPYRNFPINKLINQSYKMDIEKSIEMIEWHKKCMKKRQFQIDDDKFDIAL